MAAERYDVRGHRRRGAVRGSTSSSARTTRTTVYSQLAQQGIGREDVFENVRQQLLRREIALDRGRGAGALGGGAAGRGTRRPSESLAEVSFGYITVPDQATADARERPAARAPGRVPGGSRPSTRARPRCPRSSSAPPASCPPCSPSRSRRPRRTPRSRRPCRRPAASSSPSSRAWSTRRSRSCARSWSRRPPRRRGRGPRWSTTCATTSTCVNPRYGVLEDRPARAGDGGVVDILDDEDDGRRRRR